jgi:hypothetical protein
MIKERREKFGRGSQMGAWHQDWPTDRRSQYNFDFGFEFNSVQS